MTEFDIMVRKQEEIEHLKKEVKMFKKGYNILMDYWDSISEEERPEVDKRLKGCGL